MTGKPRFTSSPIRGRNRREMESVRDDIYERDEYTCQYCLNKFERKSLTLEHVVPVNEGGIDDMVNYITACRSCNSSKQDDLLQDFLSRRDDLTVQPDDLPIHGDIILDTIELPQEYRQIRLQTYIELRNKGNLSGSNAYKELEKRFRRQLWETDFGEQLQKKYPELPGHVRASTPLVELLEPNKNVPIQSVLLELCKSASTRTLIDEMVRSLDPADGIDRQTAIKDVIKEGREKDESTQKRIQWAFDRDNVDTLSDKAFIAQELESSNSSIPVSDGETYDVEIVDIGEKGDGITKIDGYVIIVPGTDIGDSVTVQITNTTPNVGFGEVERS